MNGLSLCQDDSVYLSGQKVSIQVFSHGFTTTQPLFYICKLKCDKISSRENTYSTVHGVSYAEKDPRVALCREGKVPDIFF